MIKPRIPIIGLKGKPGSGKSTAAAFIINKGYAKTSFAEPLKRMLEAIGVERLAVVDQARKEEPCNILSGVTPRRAMQLLGTEWGRVLHPDFWVNIWRNRVASIQALGYGVVVDDLRFPNEAAAVRALGGFVIEIVNPNAEVIATGDHPAENQDFDPDITVVNDGKSLTALHDAIDEAIQVLLTEVADVLVAA